MRGIFSLFFFVIGRKEFIPGPGTNEFVPRRKEEFYRVMRSFVGRIRAKEDGSWLNSFVESRVREREEGPGWREEGIRVNDEDLWYLDKVYFSF
jgi:hypothetical protein